MTENKGKVVSINGNLVSVEFDGNVSMNEICYVFVGDTALKSEVIRIKGNIAQVLLRWSDWYPTWLPQNPFLPNKWHPESGCDDKNRYAIRRRFGSLSVLDLSPNDCRRRKRKESWPTDIRFRGGS
mgnify:CR=1 FL=1